MQQQTLLFFWEQLASITRLILQSREWRGTGTVQIFREGNTTLIFHERGLWQEHHIEFHNVLRWTLKSDAISLEHLRQGFHHPTFLIHLIPATEHSLISNQAHVCGSDMYSGRLIHNRHGLCLHWHITGAKNEELHSHYT